MIDGPESSRSSCFFSLLSFSSRRIMTYMTMALDPSLLLTTPFFSSYSIQNHFLFTMPHDPESAAVIDRKTLNLNIFVTMGMYVSAVCIPRKINQSSPVSLFHKSSLKWHPHPHHEKKKNAVNKFPSMRVIFPSHNKTRVLSQAVPDPIQKDKPPYSIIKTNRQSIN